jgi:hypothetical protein
LNVRFVDAYDLAECQIHGMNTVRKMVRGFGGRNAAWALGAAVLACNGEGSNGTSEGGQVGPICAECQVGGGQTSDFGSSDNCSVLPGSPSDVATVRALGFSDIDRLTRTFDTPLTWTAVATSHGGPATGYAPRTMLHGEIAIESVEYVQPSDGACTGDFVRVKVVVSLSTADRSFAVSGEGRAMLFREEFYPSVYASLDLQNATGTLRLSPDDWARPVVGELNVGLVLFPEQVRGSVSVGLRDAASSPLDDTGPVWAYYPLSGDFPKDACLYHQLPFAPDQPGAAPNGESANQVLAELASRFGPDPVPATWQSGVTVQTTLARPTVACLDRSGLAYPAVPLQITSSDGRLHIAGQASAWAAFDSDAALADGWVELTHGEPLSSVELADESGIGGVELGGAFAAVWNAELYPFPTDGRAPYGELTVLGVAEDNGIIGPIAALRWSR